MAGLTIEDVNTMQDEMNKIDDDSADADAAKAAEDAAKLAEAKATEDAAKAKADEAAKDEKKDDGKPEDDEIDTVRELKEQVRASQEALKKITGDYQKLQKVMIDKGIISEDEVKEGEAAEAAKQAAFAERQGKLVEMVTIMELNPNYADVRQVCSQGNLDDIVDAFSRYYVKENGGSLQEVATKMEMEIWAEPNPYKKIYELVKKYHPKFAATDDAAAKDAAKKAEDDAKKIAAEADKVKDKKPVDATPSAASIGAGGGGTGGGGWTSAKIDALPEDELNKVPKDVYDKYLKGMLD
jgi:hypothetical protein